MFKFDLKGIKGDLFNEDWWEDSQPKVARMLRQEHNDYWAREQDPWDGSKWKDLKPKYREQKALKFGQQPILRASGKMQDQMKIKANSDGTFNVQTTKYGAAHQYGTSKLPQRTWVGIPETAVPKIEEIALKHLTNKRR